jgi:putative ABC transport system ATP-binding protein
MAGPSPRPSVRDEWSDNEREAGATNESFSGSLSINRGTGSYNAQREVAPLLERLGLGERLQHRAETLSMGERQRVMIARALSTKPSMLLADEPTGSLDTQRGREVLELLRELCRERGVAVVLVSHDPMAAHYADRVYGLRDGKLSDHQTPDRVFA